MRSLKLIAVGGGLLLAAAKATAADPATPTAPKTATAATNLFPDKVVAKGTGFEIRRTQVEDAFSSLEANLAAQGQTIPDNRRAAIEGQLLDRLIFTRLLTDKSTEADKVKAKETAEKYIDEFRKRMPTEEAFNRQLKAMGLTFEKFHADVMERATCEAVLDREVKAHITIGDDAAKKFYEENPDKFEQPEKVRASHILLMTQDPQSGTEMTEAQKKQKRAQMEKILARARAGEDFAKLAKEFSEDPGSKATGGEYTFKRGDMVPQFESAAFSLKTNQISDIVTTQFGYHIIKLSEKIPAQKQSFDKVAPEIKQYLQGQEVQKQLPAYLTDLKKHAKVEILDPVLKEEESLPKP